MLLTSSFYSMYINSQDFSCLLENQPFLPKTLGIKKYRQRKADGW